MIFLPLSHLPSVTRVRYLLFGEYTPWYRVRFTRALGTSAANKILFALFSHKPNNHVLVLKKQIMTPNDSIFHALYSNFLGNSSGWYKKTIIAFLVLNPIVVFTLGNTVAGWLLIGEFIFTLAMALKCYPLQPGGLLAI